MICYVYAFKNKLGDFFLTPFYEKQEKAQYLEGFNQSLYNCPETQLKALAECDLYYLGKYDNSSGIHFFEVEPVYMVSCESLINVVLKAKEVKDNGKD